MVEPEVVVRRAEAADAKDLAALAARTFRATFAADNRPEDIELHVARSFGRERQAAEIADPGTRTLLMEVEGQLAGFAQVRSSTAPSCVRETSPVELQRFYVDAPWIGRGVARRLMSAVFAEAATLGGESVWLGVWERNARAIAFYSKCGFVDVGSHVFLVGEDEQNDRIMVRRIDRG